MSEEKKVTKAKVQAKPPAKKDKWAEFKAHPYKGSFNALAQGMMAFGEGMTGRPFYTANVEAEQRQSQMEAEQAYYDWQKQHAEKELALTSRKQSVDDFEIKNQLSKYMMELKKTYKKDKDSAWKDLQSDMPILKNLYGEFFPDFDTNIKGMFDSQWTDISPTPKQTTFGSMLPPPIQPTTIGEAMGQTFTRLPISGLEALSRAPSAMGRGFYNIGAGIKGGITGQKQPTMSGDEAYGAWSQMMNVPDAIDWYKMRLQKLFGRTRGE